MGFIHKLQIIESDYSVILDMHRICLSSRSTVATWPLICSLVAYRLWETCRTAAYPDTLAVLLFEDETGFWMVFVECHPKSVCVALK